MLDWLNRVLTKIYPSSCQIAVFPHLVVYSYTFYIVIYSADVELDRLHWQLLVNRCSVISSSTRDDLSLFRLTL